MINWFLNWYDMNNSFWYLISMVNWFNLTLMLNNFRDQFFNSNYRLWSLLNNNFWSCLSFMLFLKIYVSLIFCCLFLFFLLCLKFLISNVLFIFFLAFFFWRNICFSVNNYLMGWSGNNLRLKVNMSIWLCLMIRMENWFFGWMIYRFWNCIWFMLFLISNILFIFWLALFFRRNICFSVNNYLVCWRGNNFRFLSNMSHWYCLMIGMKNWFFCRMDDSFLSWSGNLFWCCWY